jgi:hypothetical protein
MFDVRYEGLRIAPSYSATRELMREGKALEDAKEVLDYGIPAPRKRKKGTIEKWLRKDNKTYSAVVVRSHYAVLHEDVWLLIHFGKF